MTLAAQTAEGAARALVIAGLALALAPSLARLLAHAHGRQRTLVWALLLAPLLTPALLVSYAYSHLAPALPFVTPALYFAALTLKLVPVAALILHFFPAALSPEAAHCHSLLQTGGVFRSTKGTKAHESRSPFRVLSCLSWTTLCGPGWRHLRFRLRGAGRAPWMAGGLVFLFAFTDFELASLWSLKTWTVALFDAQVGGLALGESLRLAALPLGIELAVLVLILRAPVLSAAQAVGGKAPVRFVHSALLAYLGGAALLACVWPLACVTAQAAAGFRAVAENFVLAKDLAASLGFAATATLGAWLLAVVVQTTRLQPSDGRLRPSFGGRSRPPDFSGRVARSTTRIARSTTLAAPGLLGALLLSLALLAAFQLPLLHPAYDTPLPLLVALTLLLLPFAIPLRWLLDATRRDPALHLAKQAGSAALIWQLDTRRRWLAAFLLFCWAYFDFTAGSILAPVGLTPVFVRLHNLAHYGQTAVLSAMFLAAFAAPVAVLLLTAPAARWYARR